MPDSNQIFSIFDSLKHSNYLFYFASRIISHNKNAPQSIYDYCFKQCFKINSDLLNSFCNLFYHAIIFSGANGNDLEMKFTEMISYLGKNIHNNKQKPEFVFLLRKNLKSSTLQTLPLIKCLISLSSTSSRSNLCALFFNHWR